MELNHFTPPPTPCLRVPLWSNLSPPYPLNLKAGLDGGWGAPGHKHYKDQSPPVPF